MPKKSQNNLLKYLPFLLLIPSLLLNFYFYQRTKLAEKGLRVIDVIDGDTLVIEDKSIIKLFSIEAPELDLCGGKEAKEELEKLVLGKNITFDTRVRDKYGRQLALVYKNNDWINLAMLETGWARYNGANCPGKEQLKNIYHQAQEDKRGVFSPNCHQFENPENPNCVIKGNVARHTGEKVYHFPGCGRYEDIAVEKDLGDQWFCGELEAQEAGFTKSKNCFDKKYTPSKL